MKYSNEDVFEDWFEASNKKMQLEREGYNVEMFQEQHLIQRKDGSRYDKYYWKLIIRGNDK